MTRILNQPSDAQLGDVLISELNAGNYDEFIAIVAFARTGGVLRLAPAIRRFRQRGGRVEAFVGVDLKGTSYEALANLLQLCNDNNLHVVHAENGARTFHPKIYVLKTDRTAWVAVGSANLTAGGLWINWETCACNEYDLTTARGARGYEPIKRLVAALRGSVSGDPVRLCTTTQDIDSLLAEDYVEHEARLRLDQAADRRRRGASQHRALFGAQQRAPLPPLTTPPTPAPIVQATALREIATEDFSDEQFWFEARGLTGASRNILDLSKKGKIVLGSASSTRYETTSSQVMLGGVAFFDIDPETTTTQKDIAVNYKGKDYSGCTIKYPSGGRRPNGTWRLQLKGTSTTGDALSLLGGQGEFVGKILVFEKIRTDYYSLSSVEGNRLNEIKSNSRVVARNGMGTSSRLFGML